MGLEPWPYIGSLGPEWDQWEDRVRCKDCANKSRFTCLKTKKPIVPHDLLHRCELFAPKEF